MADKLKLPKRDPIAAYARNQGAARRVGVGALCACGEARPEALIPGSQPTSCAHCERERQGMSVMDDHHVAGAANDSTTVPVPVNDHRAELSTGQQDWPKETLANPEGSPLLRAAACIHGFIDYIIYLIKKTLLWIPEMLENLDAFLRERLGPKWWMTSPLAKYSPNQ